MLRILSKYAIINNIEQEIKRDEKIRNNDNHRKTSQTLQVPCKSDRNLGGNRRDGRANDTPPSYPKRTSWKRQTEQYPESKKAGY